MVVPRSDQGPTGEHGVPVLGLPYLQGAHFIKALGKGGGKFGGHMLHDYHPRHIGGQAQEHFFDGFGATGRGPDSNDLVGGLSQGRHLGGGGGGGGVVV